MTSAPTGLVGGRKGLTRPSGTRTSDDPAYPLCAEIEATHDVASCVWAIVEGDVTCPRRIALRSERVVTDERFRTFRVGFVDGARYCAKATAFVGHRLEPDYDCGYAAGLRARNEALTTYAAEVGFDLAGAILRDGGGS